MPDITLAEKSKRNLLIGKSWEYLSDNFHKFTEDNRIKIALELIKKSMPTLLEGKGFENKQIVIFRNEQSLKEINIGNPQQRIEKVVSA